MRTHAAFGWIKSNYFLYRKLRNPTIVPFKNIQKIMNFFLSFIMKSHTFRAFACGRCNFLSDFLNLWPTQFSPTIFHSIAFSIDPKDDNDAFPIDRINVVIRFQNDDEGFSKFSIACIRKRSTPRFVLVNSSAWWLSCIFFRFDQNRHAFSARIIRVSKRCMHDETY